MRCASESQVYCQEVRNFSLVLSVKEDTHGDKQAGNAEDDGVGR